MAEDLAEGRAGARIDAGLAAQGAYLERSVAKGERQVGWKIGFGSPAGLSALELDAPIIGFLTDRGAVAPGAAVDLTGWTAPVVECEVAALVGRDIPRGIRTEHIDEFVTAWAPAFEFADIDAPPRDVVEVLSGNIFHRSYCLGERFVASTSSVMEMTALISVDGEAVDVVDLPALTGDLRTVIARAAELAPHVGRGVQAGDIILTGSIVPPIPVRPGMVVTYRLQGSPTMAATFT